jgi:hypothetical protein
LMMKMAPTSKPSLSEFFSVRCERSRLMTDRFHRPVLIPPSNNYVFDSTGNRNAI